MENEHLSDASSSDENWLAASAALQKFRDVAEIARARNLFFVPFFGAFLAFLFAGSQTIINSGAPTQLVLAITFFFGIFYSSVVSSYFEKIETVRFLAALYADSLTGPKLRVDPEAISALKTDLASIGPHGTFERKIFKWTMRMLWASAIMMLYRIYFFSFFKFWINYLVLWVAVHWFHVGS